MAETTNNNKSEEAWLKHLEFIQNVVTRMARNSFFLKGWSVTLVAATFALTVNAPNVLFVLVALLPVIAFWILDAFYLWQERLFRRLYDDVRLNPDSIEVFSMSTERYKGQEESLAAVAFSRSVRDFHGAVVGVVVLAAILGLLFIQ